MAEETASDDNPIQEISANLCEILSRQGSSAELEAELKRASAPLDVLYRAINTTAVGYGCPPISLACSQGSDANPDHGQRIRLLIEYGGDPTVDDNFGNSVPIEFLIGRNRPSLLRAALEASIPLDAGAAIRNFLIANCKRLVPSGPEQAVLREFGLFPISRPEAEEDPDLEFLPQSSETERLREEMYR